MNSRNGQSEGDFGRLIRKSLRLGFEAAYESRYAGIALWIFGSALIFSYYWVPVCHDWMNEIGRIKTRSGFAFAAVTTALFGGTVPSVLNWHLSRRRGEKRPVHIVSNTLFWAIKGVEVDLFYILQAKVFGEQIDVWTVFVKTMVDQFVYVPLLGLLTVVLYFQLRDCHYNFAVFKSQMRHQWIRDRYLPVLISNWLLWIPAIVLIYCMPLALQIPVQNLILCFWVVVLTLMTRQTARESTPKFAGFETE